MAYIYMIPYIYICQIFLPDCRHRQCTTWPNWRESMTCPSWPTAPLTKLATLATGSAGYIGDIMGMYVYIYHL